jgi:putative salt-induced outer membrane protein YdiY
MAAVCVVATVASAQEKAAGGFKNTLSLGATMTDGNSETLQLNGALVSEGEKPGLGSVRMGIEGNYGENTNTNGTKDTTVKNAKAFINVKKTITERTFGSLDATALYDEIAKIDYRVTVGPGLGAYLVKNDKVTLSMEVAPSYVWEEVADVFDGYFAIRFAERATWLFSTASKAWQSVEYLPKASDFNDYLLSGEVGVEAPLSAGINLRLVLQDKYDNTPGADMERNDLALVAGVSVSL